MHPDEKLEICKRTRKYAAKSLLITLQNLFKSGKPISETMLRDAWLSELRKNPNFFPDGWYTPPPHGLIVLFADDMNTGRVNYKSARPEKQWPKNDIYMDKNKGIIFAYASPVDKNTGIIGDFGITLYFGQNKQIHDHMTKAIKINNEIFNTIHAGQELCAVSSNTHKILKTYNLSSNLSSPSDPTGTNTGHTIPASYEDWEKDELKILQNGNNNWEKVSSLISNKRKFVNSDEKLKIQPGMAFTIEPRPENPKNNKLPMVLFHTIAIIKSDGSKELLTNFDDLFKFAGMDYMHNI